MRTQADVSVAIATRDRPDGLARAVEAIVAGRTMPREIVVVDQGRRAPADPGALARLAGSVPLVHVRQEGSGLSRSRNAAIAAAGGAVVAFTDDDCVVSEAWLDAIWTALVTSPDLAAVTGPIHPLGADSPGLFGVSTRTSTRRAEYDRPVAPWLTGSGANTAIRRPWLDRIGGYDIRLGTGTRGRAGEDLELLYRLLCVGGRIRYEPDAVVYHERQPAARRRATRFAYGHGVGAFCGIALRQRRPGTVGVLDEWLRMRAGLTATAVCANDRARVTDEARVLIGTMCGLAYGLTSGSEADW